MAGYPVLARPRISGKSLIVHRQQNISTCWHIFISGVQFVVDKFHATHYPPPPPHNGMSSKYRQSCDISHTVQLRSKD